MFYSLGVLTSDGEFVMTLVVAVLFGISLSWCANNDFPLLFFRKDGVDKSRGVAKFLAKVFTRFNLTNKTLHPSEWYSFFKESECKAVLHLDGERRLLGYLMQFPDSPEKGHFIVINASWLLDDGTIVPIVSVDKILISSKEVLRVELLKKELDFDIDLEENDKLCKSIYNLYKQPGE